MSKVYVFGSLNMDLVIRSPRELLQGETLHGSGFMTNPGGKGANQAVACGKLGADCVMGGCIGDDAFGDRLSESLSGCGVDCSRLRRIPGVSTGVAVIVIIDRDNRIILDAGANGCAEKADVDALLSDAQAGDLLLVQLENPLPVVGYALRTAREKGMTTVLNPAPFDRGVCEYLTYVDIVIPNETELSGLTGCESICEGARALQAQGVSKVVVTLGSKGYCCVSGKEVLHEDAIPCSVVDTTAAGDTFCGALATRLAAGDALAEALRYANRAASLTVTRPGAQQAIPWAAEVGNFRA